MKDKPEHFDFWRNPRKTTLRRWIFYVHFYGGIVAGLLLSLVGITGSVITFAPELRILEVPGAATVVPTGQTVTFEKLWQTVREARPHDSFVTLNVGLGPAKGLNFRTESPRKERIHTYIDQYTGKILYQDNYHNRLLQKIYDLHSDLLLGITGRTINAWFAILLSIISITGLLLWWRGRKLWHLGFLYKFRGNWKRQSWDIHNLGGVCFLAPLVLLACTGVYYSYRDVYAIVAAFVTQGPATIAAPPASLSTANRRPLDAILSSAEQAMPECKPTIISFPKKSDESFSVRFRCASDPYHVGLSYVYVDPPTAKVLGVDRFRSAPLGVRLVRLITPVHYGDVGGLFTRILWVVVGVVPGILFVTGLLLWWSRSLSRAWHRPEAQL
jgi:uncharacterized iron-regulated membrane protein